MSTIAVDTLTKADGSQSVTSSAFAKAWANLDGNETTPTLRDSYNVSSITDSATGKPTFNFTNSMSDANYGVPSSVTRDLTSPASSAHFNQTISVSAGSYQPQTTLAGTGAIDCDEVVIATYGDLA